MWTWDHSEFWSPAFCLASASNLSKSMVTNDVSHQSPCLRRQGVSEYISIVIHSSYHCITKSKAMTAVRFFTQKAGLGNVSMRIMRQWLNLTYNSSSSILLYTSCALSANFGFHSLNDWSAAKGTLRRGQRWGQTSTHAWDRDIAGTHSECRPWLVLLVWVLGFPVHAPTLGLPCLLDNRPSPL